MQTSGECTTCRRRETRKRPSGNRNNAMPQTQQEQQEQQPPLQPHRRHRVNQTDTHSRPSRLRHLLNSVQPTKRTRSREPTAHASRSARPILTLPKPHASRSARLISMTRMTFRNGHQAKQRCLKSRQKCRSHA